MRKTLFLNIPLRHHITNLAIFAIAFFYLVVTSLASILIQACGKLCIPTKIIKKVATIDASIAVRKYCENIEAIQYLKWLYKDDLKNKKIGLVGVNAISFLTQSIPVPEVPLYWHKGVTYRSGEELSDKFLINLSTKADAWLIPRKNDLDECYVVDSLVSQKVGNSLSRHKYRRIQLKHWFVYIKREAI